MPVPPDVVKAYSYIRFSTPQQALGDSLRRQTEKAAKYAVEHGLTLDTELNLSDLGVSAFRQSNAKKGALRVFLDALEALRLEATCSLRIWTDCRGMKSLKH